MVVVRPRLNNTLLVGDWTTKVEQTCGVLFPLLLLDMEEHIQIPLIIIEHSFVVPHLLKLVHLVLSSFIQVFYPTSATEVLHTVLSAELDLFFVFCWYIKVLNFNAGLLFISWNVNYILSVSPVGCGRGLNCCGLFGNLRMGSW